MFMVGSAVAGAGAHMMGMGAQTVAPGQANVLSNMNQLQNQYANFGSQTGVLTPFMNLMGMSGPATAPGMAPDTLRQIEYSRQMQEIKARAQYQMNNQLTGVNFLRSTLGVVGLDALAEPILGRYDYRHRMRTEGALRMANVLDNSILTSGFTRAGGGISGGIRTADRFMEQIVRRTTRDSMGGLLGQVAVEGRADAREMVDIAEMLASRGEFSNLTAGMSRVGGPEAGAKRVAELAARRTVLADSRTRQLQRYFGTEDKGQLLDLLREISGVTKDIEEIDPIAVENAASKISAFAKAAGKSINEMMEVMKMGSEMAEQMGIEGISGGRIAARSYASVQQMMGSGALTRGDIAAVGGADRYTALRSGVIMQLSNTRLGRHLQLARLEGLSDVAGVREDELQQSRANIDENRLLEAALSGRRLTLDPQTFSNSFRRRSSEFFDENNILKRRVAYIEQARKENKEAIDAERGRESTFWENFGSGFMDVFIGGSTRSTRFDNIARDIKAAGGEPVDRRGSFRRFSEGLGNMFGFGAVFEANQRMEAQITDAKSLLAFTGDRSTRDMYIMGQYIGGSRRRMDLFQDMYGHIIAEKDPDGADRAGGAVLRGLANRAKDFSQNEIDQIDYFRRRLTLELGRQVSAQEAMVLFKDSLAGQKTDAELGKLIKQEQVRVQTEKQLGGAEGMSEDIRNEIIREGLKSGKSYEEISGELDKFNENVAKFQEDRTQEQAKKRRERELERAERDIGAAGGRAADVANSEQKEFERRQREVDIYNSKNPESEFLAARRRRMEAHLREGLVPDTRHVEAPAETSISDNQNQVVRKLDELIEVINSNTERMQYTTVLNRDIPDPIRVTSHRGA